MTQQPDDPGFGPVTVISGEGSGTGRLMPDDTIVMDTIELTPHWPSMARWFANGLATHSFDRGAREPVRSLIDIIRYLTATAPDEVTALLAELDAEAAASKPRPWADGIEQYQVESR